MSSLLNSVGVGVSVDVDDIGFEVWQGVLGFVVKMHHASSLEMLSLAISYLSSVFGGSYYVPLEI